MTLIAIAINPDPDGKRCGECRFSRNARGCTRQCFLHHCRIPNATCRADAKRVPACLAAEKALADVVEALKESNAYCQTWASIAEDDEDFGPATALRKQIEANGRALAALEEVGR